MGGDAARVGGKGDDEGPRGPHRGYAAAYRTVLAEVEGAVTAHERAELAAKLASKASAGAGSRTEDTPEADACKVVVVGHSLGGALAALCASRLAHDPDVTRLGAQVECVTFGQPRVGDGEWASGVDERTPRLTYTRVVKAGDLFARVPTSGFWLPGGNGGRLSVEYAHAGALVWTSAGDDEGASVGGVGGRERRRGSGRTLGWRTRSRWRGITRGTRISSRRRSSGGRGRAGTRCSRGNTFLARRDFLHEPKF